MKSEKKVTIVGIATVVGVWSDNQRSHCETGTGWTFL